jgi:hypothetical protein
MSQATVRATKREIRRAIGPEAIEAIDRIAKAGEGLAQIVAAQQEQIDALKARLVYYEMLISQAATLNECRANANSAFRGRRLWQRLRWLVRGT